MKSEVENKLDLLIGIAKSKSKSLDPNQIDKLRAHRSTGLKRLFTCCSKTNSLKCANSLELMFKSKGKKSEIEIKQYEAAKKDALEFFNRVLDALPCDKNKTSKEHDEERKAKRTAFVAGLVTF